MVVVVVHILDCELLQGKCNISETKYVGFKLVAQSGFMFSFKSLPILIFCQKVKKICSVIKTINCDFYGSYRFLTPFKENSSGIKIFV